MAATLGASAADDAAGGTISATDADVPRAPASTLKLLTAVTALEVLGVPVRFTTKLVAHGAIANGVLDGTLAFVGGGDPVLSSADLDDGVAALARRGVHRMRSELTRRGIATTGVVRNDGSGLALDDRRSAPFRIAGRDRGEDRSRG